MVLFSDKISDDAAKAELVANINDERGPHLLKELPLTASDLQLSQSFFATTFLDSSFLAKPVVEWKDDADYIVTAKLVNYLACVNDC